MLIERKLLREFFEKCLQEELLSRIEFTPDELCQMYFQVAKIKNTLEAKITFLNELREIFNPYENGNYNLIYFASTIDLDTGLRYRAVGIDLNPVNRELWNGWMNRIYRETEILNYEHV